jgi:hypothetical protein
MAKEPEEVFEALLPSGRGVRFVKINIRLLMDITERASSSLHDKATQTQQGIAVEKEIVATCIRGVTWRPLERKFKKGLAAPAEAEGAALAQALPPELDLEATFAPHRDPAKRTWRDLAYATLIADGDSNMFEIFDEPAEWNAVLDRVNAASGRSGADPFKGLRTRTTAA